MTFPAELTHHYVPKHKKYFDCIILYKRFVCFGTECRVGYHMCRVRVGKQLHSGLAHVNAQHCPANNCYPSPVPSLSPPPPLYAGDSHLQCVRAISASRQDAHGGGRDSRVGAGVRVGRRCLAASGRVSDGE